jgi:lysophospholipase L1-like esterase
MRATSRSEPRVPRRYAALGDSFTAGAAGNGDTGFADSLAQLLRDANPGLEYRNLAVAGARSVEVAGEQLPEALAFEPDVVTLVSGGNDALLAVRPDVHAHMAAFEGALEELRAELLDAAIVTATTPDPGRFLPLRPRSARRISTAIERINEATRAAAARHGVPCLDFAAHPEALTRGNYASDGYHPSPSSSRRAAGAFAEVFGVQLGIQLDLQEVL